MCATRTRRANQGRQVLRLSCFPLLFTIGLRGRRPVATYRKIIMTLRISRPAALSSLALALTACYAHAEPVAADTVVVTATRSPQPLANVISDSVTISAEQITESGAG